MSDENSQSTVKSNLIVAAQLTLAIYLIPVLLCVLGWLFAWQMGPIVFFLSLATALMSIPLYVYGLAPWLGSFLAICVSLLLSAFSGIVFINYFMVLTYLFGIKNYV